MPGSFFEANLSDKRLVNFESNDLLLFVCVKIYKDFHSAYIGLLMVPSSLSGMWRGKTGKFTGQKQSVSQMTYIN